MHGYDKESTYLEVQSDDVFNVLKVTFQLCKTATQWNGSFCSQSINGIDGQCVQELHPMIGCGLCSLDDTKTEYEICPLDSTIYIPEDRCLSEQNDNYFSCWVLSSTVSHPGIAELFIG